MSYAFDFAMYAAAIIATLALYGSTLKSSKSSKAPASIPASIPTPALAKEVTVADFPEEISELEISEETIAQLLTEVGFEQPSAMEEAIVPIIEDVIVPFIRKPKPVPADNLETLGIRALRQIASELKISKYSRKSKAQLIAKIRSIRDVKAA